MHPDIESRLLTIEIKKRRKRKYGISIFCLSFIAILIYLYVRYIIRLYLIAESLFILLPISVGVMLLSLSFVFLNNEDQALIQIVKSMDLIQKSHNNPEIKELAYKCLINAVENLEYYSKQESNKSGIWLSKAKQIEQDFINNIKLRLSPAVREGRILPSLIQDVALSLISSDTDLMESMNNRLEERLEVKEIPKKNLIFYSKTFFGTKLGKLFASLIYGYFGGMIIIIFGCILTGYNFWIIIKDNFLTALTLCMAFSMGILGWMLKD